MTCLIHVEVLRRGDHLRAQELFESITEELGAGEDVADGRRFVLPDEDDMDRARTRIAAFLDRQAPDWRQHLKID